MKQQNIIICILYFYNNQTRTTSICNEIMQNVNKNEKTVIAAKIKQTQENALRQGVNKSLLHEYNKICNFHQQTNKFLNRSFVILVVLGSVITVICANVLSSFLNARCLISNNYLVWEATRPLADCQYCINVTKPIILRNITRQDFEKYAYLSKPIIVKNAISHWKAKVFTFDMFKRLYEETEGSYESLDDGCQFLNFKTDLFSLKDVFDMPEERKRNDPGQKPWYVGWGNCHPTILSKLRQYYDIPDFLPADAEFPATENIFIGYDMGAVMHLDYIPRLMWQGQVLGNKTWTVAPVPECDYLCKKFEYYVEPGDIVLLDTRIWYHSTKIATGQFSLTVQSEYG